MFAVFLLIFLPLIGGQASTRQKKKEFEEYVRQFEIEVDNWNYRLGVFTENLEFIEAFNGDELASSSSLRMGITKFAHWTREEFSEWVSRGVFPFPSVNSRVGTWNENGIATHNSWEWPNYVDWVSRGAVTPVKDQGRCGNCYAFSATGSLEGAYFVQYGTLPGGNVVDSNTNFTGLSEMQLTACDALSLGCNGGYVQSAYIYALQTGGLVDEAQYPYNAGPRVARNRRGDNEKGGKEQKKSPRCNTSAIDDDSQISFFLQQGLPYTVLEASLESFMSAIQRQPFSVLIEANPLFFHHYKSGVITNSPRAKCGTNLNHAVLIVGYGTWVDGTPYWKVKNSWGVRWGDEGYVLIERSRANVCGILEQGMHPNLFHEAATAPTLAPSEVPTRATFSLHQNVSGSRSYVLDPSATRPAEICLEAGSLAGSAFGISAVSAVACLSCIYSQHPNRTMHWVLGVVHGNSTYATYVKIQAGINGLVTVAQGASAFEIPEYGVELSCEILNFYEEVNFYEDQLSVSLEPYQVVTTELRYYVQQDPIDFTSEMYPSTLVPSFIFMSFSLVVIFGGCLLGSAMSAKTNCEYELILGSSSTLYGFSHVQVQLGQEESGLDQENEHGTPVTPFSGLSVSPYQYQYQNGDM